MEKSFAKTVVPYVVATLIGTVGGLSLWYFGPPDATKILKNRVETRRAKALENLGLVEGEGNPRATEYVRALQGGQCDTAIELTLWMQERLHNAKIAGSGEEKLREIRRVLCAGLTTRTPEDNQFAQEGVKDQYIFNSSCTWKVVGLDTGRKDLSVPAQDRTWFEVSYPSKIHSIRDIRGMPVKSLVVGINITNDGKVLKAGVIGNLDIDFETFSYSWSDKGD